MLPKKYLLLIAGIAWTFAGAMVVKTGWPLFIAAANMGMKIVLAIIICYIFYFIIFSKLVVKHTERIVNDERTKMPFWDFFDRKSYIIMAIMIIGGITIRKLELLPKFVIGFFYLGLGVALFSCGLRFIFGFLNFKNKAK